MSCTPFVDGAGNLLDLRNVGFRIKPATNKLRSGYNQRYNWGDRDGSNQNATVSGIFIASESAKTIIIPGKKGNPGSYDQNAFILMIGLASSEIREITGILPMLDQNIAPGVYSSTVTLEAIPYYD